MIDRNKHWPIRHFGGHWTIGHWPGLAVIAPEITTGNLRHSPAYILREHLVDESVLGDITGVTFWPSYVAHLPEVEGNIVALNDTTPIVHDRVYEGMYFTHYGVQVILKSDDYETGLEKMEEIVSTCESLHDVEVIIDSSITYIVRICAFTTGIVYLGYERGTGRRCVFSLNLLITVVRIL